MRLPLLCLVAVVTLLLCFSDLTDAQGSANGNSRQLGERVQKQMTELTKWIDKHVLLRFSASDDLLSTNKAPKTAVKTFKKPSELWEVRRVFQDQAPWRLNLAVFAKADIPEGTVLSALDFDKTYNFRKLTTDFPGLNEIFPLKFWSENSIDEAVPLTLWMLLHKNVLKKDSELHPFLKTIWMLFEEFEGIEGLSSWGSTQEMADIKHQILAHPWYPSGWYETKEAHEETAEGLKIIKDNLFSRDPVSLGLPTGTSWTDVIPSDRTWRVAYFLVRSRCWNIGGRRTMMPLLDLVNHDSIQAQAAINLDQGFAKMITLKPIKKGDEIFISYGEHSSEKTLELYGFVPPPVPFDEIRMIAKTPLIPDPSLRAVFDPKFLQSHQVTENSIETIHSHYVHSFPVVFNSMSWELIDFARICVVNNISSESFNITEDRSKWLFGLERNFPASKVSQYNKESITLNSLRADLDIFHQISAFREAFFQLINFSSMFRVPIDRVADHLEGVSRQLQAAIKIFHKDLKEFKSISKNVQQLEHTFNILSLRLAFHRIVQSAQINMLDQWQTLLIDEQSEPNTFSLFFSLDLGLLDLDTTLNSFTEPASIPLSPKKWDALIDPLVPSNP